MDGDARASPRAVATPHCGTCIAVLDFADNGRVTSLSGAMLTRCVPQWWRSCQWRARRNDRHDRHDVSALWQMETRNLIEDFAAEADALAAVRQMMDVSGTSPLADVVLLASPRDGDAPMRTVAAGPELVFVAQRGVPPVREVHLPATAHG